MTTSPNSSLRHHPTLVSTDVEQPPHKRQTFLCVLPGMFMVSHEREQQMTYSSTCIAIYFNSRRHGQERARQTCSQAIMGHQQTKGGERHTLHIDTPASSVGLLSALHARAIGSAVATAQGCTATIRSTIHPPQFLRSSWTSRWPQGCGVWEWKCALGFRRSPSAPPYGQAPLPP